MATQPTDLPDWASNATFGAGGRPWNGQPNKTNPGAGVIAEGFDPENPIYADLLNWILNNHGNWLNYISAGGSAQFGSGIMGTATLDGAAAAPTGMFKSGTTYFLLQDYAADSLTVTGAGTVLNTNGFRLFVANTLTTSAGGKIRCVGGDAVGITGGAAPSNGANTAWGSGGTLVPGIAGVNGTASNANGAAGGVNPNPTYGGAGGGGGTAGGSTGGAVAATITPELDTTAGKGGSAATWSGILQGLVVSLTTPFPTAKFTPLGGGGGGSAGGSLGGGSTSGGSGAGGGVMVIGARILNLADPSDISVAGGKGGDASGAGTGAGGGGGGGGGDLHLAYASKGSSVFAASINCPGGAGGAGQGTGAAGAAGVNGTLHEFPFFLTTSPSLPAPVTTHSERGNVSVSTSDTVITINFATPFAAAPPSVGGYRFNVNVARTDGDVGTPSWTITTLAVDHLTITLNDSFQGVISYDVRV